MLRQSEGDPKWHRKWLLRVPENMWSEVDAHYSDLPSRSVCQKRSVTEFWVSIFLIFTTKTFIFNKCYDLNLDLECYPGAHMVKPSLAHCAIGMWWTIQGGDCVFMAVPLKGAGGHRPSFFYLFIATSSTFPYPMSESTGLMAMGPSNFVWKLQKKITK